MEPYCNALSKLNVVQILFPSKKYFDSVSLFILFSVWCCNLTHISTWRTHSASVVVFSDYSSRNLNFFSPIERLHTSWNTESNMSLQVANNYWSWHYISYSSVQMNKPLHLLGANTFFPSFPVRLETENTVCHKALYALSLHGNGEI